MSQRDYSALPGINFSALKHMAVSPLLYKHRLTVSREDSDTFRHGRLGHCAILEPERLLKLPKWEKAKRDDRDAEWLAFEAANEDYYRADELSRFIGLATAVRSDPLVAPLLRSGVVETMVSKIDPRTGLLRKGRPDLRDGSRLLEVKLTKMTLSRRMIEKQIAGLLYHVQAAYYMDLCDADRWDWLFAEQFPPFDHVVVPAKQEMIERGRELYHGWLDRVVECTESGVWPGVAGGEPMDIELPAYAMGELPELTMNGEEFSL